MRTCKDCGQTLPDRVFAAIKGTRWRHTRYNRCRNIRQRERRKAAVLPPTVNQVLGAVAEVTGIDAALILRPDPVLDARIVAAHLLRYPAGLSTKEIHDVLGLGASSVAKRATARARRADLIARVRLRMDTTTDEPHVVKRRGHPRGASGPLFGLKSAREAAGLSMRELSVQAGLPRETISRLENLHRATSLQSLESLASALGVTAHTLTLPRRETAGG